MAVTDLLLLHTGCGKHSKASLKFHEELLQQVSTTMQSSLDSCNRIQAATYAIQHLEVCRALLECSLCSLAEQDHEKINAGTGSNLNELGFPTCDASLCDSIHGFGGVVAASGKLVAWKLSRAILTQAPHLDQCRVQEPNHAGSTSELTL